MGFTRNASRLKKHRLVLPLQHHIPPKSVGIGWIASGNEGPGARAAVTEHRVLRVRGFPFEVDTRHDWFQQPARKNYHEYVRCLWAAVGRRDLARNDGADGIVPGLVSHYAAEAGTRAVPRPAEAPGRIGLPELDQGIRHRLAGAVDNGAAQPDMPTRRGIGKEDRAFLPAQSVGEEWADGLGRSDEEFSHGDL